MKRGSFIRATMAVLLAATGTAHATTVTRGPYLQTPTPASMIVRWRTDTAVSSRVQIGAAPGSLATDFDDVVPKTEHEITVTGLTPDTQYYYSVGSVLGAFVGDDANHFFRTAPTAGTPLPFRIWTIGDAGFTGANLNAVRNAFSTYNGGSATDLFLLLGDNAYVIGTDAQFQAAVFDAHASMLRTTPVYSVFGNHEDFSSDDLAQTGPYFDIFSFPTAAQAGGVASGTEAYYSFDYANVHFVVLDSEGYTPTAPLTGAMLTWLQADLAATTADWTIALWHRPPYSRGLLHNSDLELNEINMRQYVVPVLESYGVDLVLTGHSHSYERSYFIDGHHGLAATFSDAHKKDLGDGDPTGDGAYRKTNLGPEPNSGAVYVVNGSGSEVRNATLDHPAHLVGLLTLGSMVIDVEQDRLTARFLSSTGSVDDQFQIVKSSTCAPTPAAGCVVPIRSQLRVRDDADPARSRWRWRWRGDPIDASDVGSPGDETDVAICVYDAAGVLLGGQLFHGASEWGAISHGLLYRDRTASRLGLQRIKILFGNPARYGVVDVKGKGAGIGNPPLPATTPITAQLVNLDNGACWSSTFATTRQNTAQRVSAVLP